MAESLPEEVKEKVGTLPAAGKGAFYLDLRPKHTLAYTSPTDQRPSMDVYQVVRETFDYPLTYDAIAGTKLQPLGPLFALPLPLSDSGTAPRQRTAHPLHGPTRGDPGGNWNGPAAL